MAPESTRGPNIRELESLRITRSEESPRRRLLLAFVLAVLAVAILGVVGLRRLRPHARQTARSPDRAGHADCS